MYTEYKISQFLLIEKTTVSTGTRTGVSRKKGTSSSEMSVHRSSAEESVRYKGSKESSVHKGSEQYFEYSCAPCSTEGYHVEAQGFCTNCDDYLCGPCFKSHSRNKASRYHTLLDNDNMPKKYKHCDPCKFAGDEEKAVGYCTDCGEYLCSSCFRSHSRNKASRQHVLLDQNNMPGWTEGSLAFSVGKMNISKEGAGPQKYNEEYIYIRDIGVKTNEDEKDCYIVDMALVSSTQLVLADYNNKSLKLVDLEKDVITDNLRLLTIPSGLTAISQTLVAVVLSDKGKIQIVSVSERLSVVRTLNTDGYCVDVTCVSGKLYVSFKEPVKFQILQLTGAIDETINPDKIVLNHCTLPRYIAVSPDQSMIYISDWKTDKVTCMDMKGRMISLYQDELKETHDITVSPFGSVYLCNRIQHVVYKMTSAMTDCTVILGRGDGVYFPNAMCFNADKQHLYISSSTYEAEYCNFMKVYKWK